jgi:hypothetical protein
MSHNAFLLNRIPPVFLSPERDKPIHYARLFLDDFPLEQYLEKAATELFPRNSSFLIRMIIGYLSNFHGNLWFTTPGSHSEHRTILSLFKERGITSKELFTGNGRPVDLERMADWLTWQTGISRREAEDRQRIFWSKKTEVQEQIVEGEVVGIQLQKAALNALEGRGDLLASLRSNFDTSKIPMALAGGPVTQQIISDLEERKVTIRLTEEACNEFFYFGKNVLEDMQLCNWPCYGTKQRAVRFAHVVKQLGLHGVIFLLAPLSHEHLEFEIFRQELDCPILALELTGAGQLDRRSALRISAFLEMIS